MTASFELEHPLQDRKTLRGWVSLATPVLLHHFACDSAERMLCFCEKGGHVIDPIAWKALYTKRRWIEGKQTDLHLQEALRELLMLTLAAVEVDTGLAWSYLAVAEAIHTEPAEAALKASAKTARAAAIFASRKENVALHPLEETAVSTAFLCKETTSTPPAKEGLPCLYAPSHLRRVYLLRTTASIFQWQEHPYFQKRLTASLRAWIFERFWQEDHLAMLIAMMSRQRNRLLAILSQRQDSKQEAAQRWQHLWQDILFEA